MRRRGGVSKGDLRYEAWLVFRELSKGKFPPPRPERPGRAEEIGWRMVEAAWRVLEEEAPEEQE
jgi:hypothetical protein